MAEVARWTEGSLKPERYHDSVFPSIEDRELSERIRSLLSLHNRGQFPTLSHPSPGLAQSVNEPEGLYAGHKPISRQSSNSNVSEPIARLSLKDFQQPFQGTRESLLETSPYARPTAKVKDSHDNGHRDNQDQPEIDRGRRLNRGQEKGPEATSTTFSLTPQDRIGLVSRQSESLTSQPTSGSSSRPTSYPAKNIVRSHLPLYKPRTVPPHTSQQPEAPMNPEVLHVPGDYQSETEASTPRGFQTPSVFNEVSNSAIQAKPPVYSHAVKALSSVKGYDGSDSTQSSIRTEPSEVTLASTNSTLPSGHPPSDVFVGQLQPAEVVEPRSTMGSDKRPYPKGLEQASTAASEEQRSRDRLMRLQSMNAHDQEANMDSRNQVTHSCVTKSGLSASMRPEASTQALQPAELPTNDITSTRTKDAPGRRTTVLSSPSVIEDLPVNSFHRPTGFGGNLEAKSPIPDINKNQSSDVDTPPSQARRSSSLDSVQNKQILSNLDDRRLTEQASATGDPEPKRHWIRALLSPRSNTSSSHNQTNLTARPTRQNSSTGTTAKRQMPGNGSELAVPDVTQCSKGTNGSSEKTIALQEQKATAAFTKVVQDLETLLKEALSVARQAADSNGDRHGPLVTNSPVTSRSSFQSVDQTENSSQLSGGLDEEEHYTSSPLQHNRSDIPIDANNIEPRFVPNKDAKPYPGRSVAPTRHQSIVPVPGRVKICPKRASSHSAKEFSLAYTNTSEIAIPAEESAQQGHNDVSSVIGDVQDWAFNTQASHSGKAVPMPQQPGAQETPLNEHNALVKRENTMKGKLQKKFMIQPRTSSAGLRSTPLRTELPMLQSSKGGEEEFQGEELQSSDGQHRKITQHAIAGRTERRPFKTLSLSASPVNSAEGVTPLPRDQDADKEPSSMSKQYTLKNRRHYSIREGNGFSLSRSHRRAPIARDWSTSRKRYVATVSCISTALMGLIIGIYAGEVPAIQYAIQDEHHYSILGNVVLFSGLAITTVLFWPLPLLHGRKTYLLAAFALLLPLQFPQALAVGSQQKEHIAIYRVGLLVSRAVSGLVMGFASLNFKNTLLDLFGASLQSANPHQETVNKNDVRRHGGGMGVWLGIWTWCSIGSIGIGFLIGAVIISGLSVAWGFWIVIILCAFVLILNVFSPETRRSAYRRSMAEVRNGRDISRRVARGEIKMHIDSTGPIWWGEELLAGWRLCVRMLKQPGFLILSFYVAWIYGQVVMVIMVSCCGISPVELWLIS